MKAIQKKDPFFRAVEFYKPYVVARPAVVKKLNLEVMGIKVLESDVYNPFALKSGPFLEAVHTLHNLVCGPFGMVMEKWVGYDCGLVPGVVFGFGRDVSEVSPAIRNGLQVPDDYEGLVPFSIAIAIPLPDRQTWEIHSLGSLNHVAPGAGPAGLNRLTLSFGTGVLRAKRILGILRWRSDLPRTSLRHCPCSHPPGKTAAEDPGNANW